MQLFLQHKPYRVLTLSILLGIFGTTLFDLVSVLYAATFPNPELAVGLASLITSLPYVFDFIVGYVSDRASNSFKAMKLVRWLQMSLYVFFGVLTLLKPSWWVFVLVLAINFMSDIIGNYTAYLNLSLNRRVVDEENFSLAISFRKGMSNIVTLAGKSVGRSVLIAPAGSLNYFLFALINVLVFLASYLVLRRGRKLFDHLDEPIPESKEQQAESLKALICQFVRDTITNFTFLKSQSSIFNLVMIYSSMNLLSSAMATLLMIYLLSVKELQLGSYAVTITVFESIELVAFFLGSLFPVRTFTAKVWSIRSNLLF
ncbi:MAG: peptidase [Streptococcus thermophilus]